MRFESQRNLFTLVLTAILIAGFLTVRVTHAGDQVLIANESAVVEKVDLIDEIFGIGSLQTDIYGSEKALGLNTFEQSLFAHTSISELYATEGASRELHGILSKCVAVALIPCKKANSVC